MGVRPLSFAVAFVLAVSAPPVVSQPPAGSPAVRIGVLAGGGSAFRIGFEPFRQRLRELGYVEGENLGLEVRNAEGRAERYPAFAAELVRLKVDLIVVQGNAALVALRQETQTIPIVMTMIGDPVGAGFVASLAKPGGNITGVANMAEDISAKWVELLREASPSSTRMGVLWDPTNAAHVKMAKAIRSAADTLGIGTAANDARGPDGIEAAFAAMAADKVDAVIVLPDPAFGARLGQIATLAAKHRMASISFFPEFSRAGGLMSYGPSFAHNWIRAADYVDRIVNGAKPADLAVGQPLKFELIVNRKTEKALGLALPSTVLLRADEVLQ
jgi:putative ABC transport system substrate-binding protein